MRKGKGEEDEEKERKGLGSIRGCLDDSKTITAS